MDAFMQMFGSAGGSGMGSAAAESISAPSMGGGLGAGAGGALSSPFPMPEPQTLGAPPPPPPSPFPPKMPPEQDFFGRMVEQMGSGVASRVGQKATDVGMNAVGLGPSQPLPPMPEARLPQGAPGKPIVSNAMQTPSSRRPISPSGKGGLGGISAAQLAELKKRGLV